MSAYGGEELTPPQYGRVFISAKPKNGSFLSDFTKKDILSSLKNYSVAGIVPTFVDLKFLFVEIDTYIYYNPNFAGNAETLKTSVVNSLASFANNQPTCVCCVVSCRVVSCRIVSCRVVSRRVRVVSRLVVLRCVALA